MALLLTSYHCYSYFHSIMKIGITVRRKRATEGGVVARERDIPPGRKKQRRTFEPTFSSATSRSWCSSSVRAKCTCRQTASFREAGLVKTSEPRNAASPVLSAPRVSRWNPRGRRGERQRRHRGSCPNETFSSKFTPHAFHKVTTGSTEIQIS